MKYRIPSIFSAASFVGDGLFVAGSFLLANWVRFQSGWIEVHNVTRYSHYRSFLLLMVAIHLLIFKYVGLYRKRRGISGVDELSKVIQGVFISTILVSASTFLFKFFTFSRLVIGLAALFVILGVWLDHVLLRRIQILLRRRGVGVTRILVVGTGETAKVLL